MIDEINASAEPDLYFAGQLSGLRWYCAYSLDDDIEAESISEDLADEIREDFLAGFAWELLRIDVLYLAEPVFERLTLIAPCKARSWHGYGAVLLEGEKWEHAIEALLRATQLEPDFPSSHYLLGEGYGGADLPGKAADAFEAYLALKPNDSDALIRCGIAHSDAGEFERSIAKFEQAITIDSGSVSAYYNLAIVGLRLNDIERLHDVQALLEREAPDDWRFPMVTLSLQELSGHREEAWANFESAFAFAVEADDEEGLDHIVESALKFAFNNGFENRADNWIERVFQYHCVSSGVLFHLRKLTEPELSNASCFSIMIEGELSAEARDVGANLEETDEVVGYVSTVRVSAKTEKEARQIAMGFDRRFGRRPASTELLEFEGPVEDVYRGVYWCAREIHTYPLDDE